MKFFKSLVFGKNKSTEASKMSSRAESISDQQLRDNISVGRLNVDLNAFTISIKEFNASEKAFFTLIELLNKQYIEDDLIAFDKTIEKYITTELILLKLVGIFSEMAIKDYETEMIFNIVKIKKPQIDSKKIFLSVNEDRAIRTNLRKIEYYIVKNHKHFDKRKFDNCIIEWEEAEQKATKKALLLMHELLTSN